MKLMDKLKSKFTEELESKFTEELVHYRFNYFL